MKDHPLRAELANELHARPFPVLSSPCQVSFLAIKIPENVQESRADAHHVHLASLLQIFDVEPPETEASHFVVRLGGDVLKWENHTEFVTYTIFRDGPAEESFSGSIFEDIAPDWLAKMPGERIASALVHVEPAPSSDSETEATATTFFEPESLAVSRVHDGSAVVSTDFRLDSGGHTRFAVFVSANAGQRAIGRIVQRLLEIEIYKTMSLLGLPVARTLEPALSVLEAELSTLVSKINNSETEPEETLQELLSVAARLEQLLSKNSFRFAATKAYYQLLEARVEVLREQRFLERQTIREFMMRRFEPAMRTCFSAAARLERLAQRAERASDLLRTRVNVDRAEQSHKLLASMDRRADLQLRLQKTVEGLSVVAISYYAVNLATYLVAPLITSLGISKTALSGILVVPIVTLVWLVVRRIRRAAH